MPTRSPSRLIYLASRRCALPTVQAGAEPLYYQWRKGTSDLIDTSEISGSTSSNLVINPATSSDAGTYSVLVSNAFGAVTSSPAPLTIVADKAKPSVAIASPVPNARTTNSVISGYASDDVQVSNVFWWITNINAGVVTTNSGSADLDTNGTTNRTWSISNAVAPGTNIVSVRSVNYSGILSSIVTEQFFYVAPTNVELTISASGSGMFGFDVSGPSGLKVVIEASTDLQTWIPVQTNLLGSAPFSITNSATNSERFYRAELVP